MNFSSISRNLILIFIFFILVLVGIYFCYSNSYGWDWDTYGMLNTFYNILENSIYIKSRGTGYLVPEIIIGFFSHYFGSFFLNLLSFFLLISSLIIFYYSLLANKIYLKNLLLFLIFCLSNYIIMRDSTIPMDYPWALFFFSLGIFFYSRKNIEFTILFFALAIGSRINYLLFIYPIIFYYNNGFSLNKKIIFFIIIFFFGGLFYIPSWISSGFSLDFLFSSKWYNHYRPDPIFSLIGSGKFFYKTFLTIGYFSCIVIGINLVYLWINKKYIKIHNTHIIFFLIILNLILYFFFPWQQAHLWIFIISFYFFLVQVLNRKLILLLIFLNLTNWFFQFHPITVLYKKYDCYNELIDYKPFPTFTKGFIFQRSERHKWTLCYPGDDFPILKKYEKNIKRGYKINY